MRVSDSPGKGSSSNGEEESRHHVVLDESTEWSAVLGNQILVVGRNLGEGEKRREGNVKGDNCFQLLWKPASINVWYTNVVGFCPGHFILGKVRIHLIAIKVSVVTLAVGIVQP